VLTENKQIVNMAEVAQTKQTEAVPEVSEKGENFDDKMVELSGLQLKFLIKELACKCIREELKKALHKISD